jgi:hypothetical protein
MKTSKTRSISPASALALFFLFAFVSAHAAPPAPAVKGEELAVWQAMAAIVAAENTEKPIKVWYYQSDFSAASFISVAMDDPEKAEFCGLNEAMSKSMIAQLKEVSAQHVTVEPDTVESVGFKLSRKKPQTIRYFALSRVVFNATLDSAWLSIDLNGVRGSIVRLDKTDGTWKRTSRCGAWYMPDRVIADAPTYDSAVFGQRKR